MAQFYSYIWFLLTDFMLKWVSFKLDVFFSLVISHAILLLSLTVGVKDYLSM